MKKTMILLALVLIANNVISQVSSNPSLVDAETIKDYYGKYFYYNNVTNYNPENAPYPYSEGR